MPNRSNHTNKKGIHNHITIAKNYVMQFMLKKMTFTYNQ